jgi:hypothetical protein
MTINKGAEKINLGMNPTNDTQQQVDSKAIFDSTKQCATRVPFFWKNTSYITLQS